MTSVGDVWKVGVKAGDYQNWSSETESNTVEILSNVSSDNSPTTTLNLPADSYSNDTSDPVNVIFNCSATDDSNLANISFYITNSTNQSFALNQTTIISGTSNSTTWTLSLANGNYTWNCLAYDNASQTDWNINRTIKINYTAPPAPSCGDGTCNGAESCSSCEADCGACPSTGGSSGSGISIVPAIVNNTTTQAVATTSTQDATAETQEQEEQQAVEDNGPAGTELTGSAVLVGPINIPKPEFAIPAILLFVILIALVSIRHLRLSKTTKKLLTGLHAALIGIIMILLTLTFVPSITGNFGLKLAENSLTIFAVGMAGFAILVSLITLFKARPPKTIYRRRTRRKRKRK